MPRPLAASPLLLALLLSASPRPTLAQTAPTDDSERANALFKKGKDAYNENRVQDAYRLYGEAWQLKKSPDIAANLAQTETDLHLPRAAADHFGYALDHLLPSSTEEQKKALTEGLETEKKEIGTLHMTLEPADIAVVVDGVPTTLRPSGDVYVDPGEHHCTFTHEGYQTSEQTVQVSKGGSQVMWIKLDAVGAAAAAQAGALPRDAAANPNGGTPDAMEQPRGGGGRSLAPVFVGGGIAVVGLAAGVGFMLSANSHRDKANGISAQIPGDSGCGAGTAYASQCADLKTQNDSVASARTIETVSFAVAGVAAVGTVVYLLWPSGHQSASALKPGFAVARGVGSMSLSGSF